MAKIHPTNDLVSGVVLPDPPRAVLFMCFFIHFVAQANTYSAGEEGQAEALHVRIYMIEWNCGYWQSLKELVATVLPESGFCGRTKQDSGVHLKVENEKKDIFRI
ncbi:hypothetical protein AVEN_197998-1 [Araneus ventricosus]|uniref:Uncharacterized protein n=1 Tax=Araneus ventricosus TaxID=182803 RepID=A0A4Y2DCM1_ARAVE|nr:hypothetical protein AVEN_197998-1 [Araneus ventricosus]